MSTLWNKMPFGLPPEWQSIIEGQGPPPQQDPFQTPQSQQDPYASISGDYQNLLNTMLQNNEQWQAMNQPEKEDTPEEKEAKRKAKIWRNVRYGLAAVGDAMQNYARGINPNTMPQGFVQRIKNHELAMKQLEEQTEQRKAEIMKKIYEDIESRAWDITKTQTETPFQKAQREHWEWEAGKPPKAEMKPWQKEAFGSEEEWQKYHAEKRGLETEKTKASLANTRALTSRTKELIETTKSKRTGNKVEDIKSVRQQRRLFQSHLISLRKARYQVPSYAETPEEEEVLKNELDSDIMSVRQTLADLAEEEELIKKTPQLDWKTLQRSRTEQEKTTEKSPSEMTDDELKKALGIE